MARPGWGVVIICGVLGLVGVAVAVGSVVLLVGGGLAADEPGAVLGVARPTPAWLAVVGGVVGTLGGLGLAIPNLRWAVRRSRDLLRRRARRRLGGVL